MTAVLDPKAVAAVNDAARLELENNQLAPWSPSMGTMGSSGTLLGGLRGGRGSGGETTRQRLGLDPHGELTADENIARQLTRLLGSLFGADGGSAETKGPLETPVVPPGGDTRLPGYPGDSRQPDRTPGYESDPGSVGTPGYPADQNGHQGGSVMPMPDQQGPQIITNENYNNQNGGATNNGQTPEGSSFVCRGVRVILKNLPKVAVLLKMLMGHSMVCQFKVVTVEQCIRCRYHSRMGKLG